MTSKSFRKSSGRSKLSCATIAGIAAAGLAAMGLACDVGAPRKEAASPPARTEPTPAPDLTELVHKELLDVAGDPDVYSRARRLGTLLPTLGPETVEAAKLTLQEPLLDLRAADYELLLHYWASYEPEAASRWARKKSPLAVRPNAVMAALSTWAQLEPQKASKVAWEWTVDSRELERVVPIAIVRGWFASGDPPQLRDFLSKLPPGIIQQRAIAAYTRVVMEKKGIEPVMAWVESLPDDNPGFKLAVNRRVVDQISMLDLQAALRWCDKFCDGPYGKNMRNIIARNWEVTDAPAALAWLKTSEKPGYQRDLDVRVTFAKWSRENRDAAVAWLQQHITNGELEPWLHSIYPVYAVLVAKDSPADAMKWAAKIDSDQERREVYVYIAREWRRTDEAAAEAWLSKSPLSEKERARVLAPLGPDRRKLLQQQHQQKG